MAEKRKKQTAVFGTNQPRDENRAFGHDVQRSEQKQKSGKNKAKDRSVPERGYLWTERPEVWKYGYQ